MESVALQLLNYRAAAAQHGHASAMGDSSTANRQYQQLMRAYHALQQQGADAIAQLLPLLDEADLAVASWAATHLLPYYEPAATAALLRIRQQPGIVAFGAAMVLQEWQNGRLRIE